MKTKSKFNLFGASAAEIKKLLTDLGEPAFREKQIRHWIYVKRVLEIEQMTNLSKSLREKLQDACEVRPPLNYERHLSRDGSIKFVFHLEAGGDVEAVYMPMTKGVTMCLSSQVGCAQACSFCMTAQMGFIRNLTPAEIVGQAFVIAREMELNDPFNIVMMGMGEPLLNLNNLTKSLDHFVDALGLNLSPRRITVSTSGHVRNLLKLGEYPRLPRIAVSLNATTDEQRNHLMPVNLKWNIEALLAACRRLPIPPRERITLEYVLIEGLNDSPADAKRLVRLVANLRCKINLIPFNETPELEYKQPALPVIERFQEILNRSKILNTVRWSKGRDIGAACGQLATPIAKRGPNLRVG
ncbi:23S rRNA (adenine(2503)-C(2))-methyltransferase RlmN [Acanthopleuribacter pedis]|uniref:Probable dual-specificity RNA methyltransferase RlmN n=1 Tax=Acanthopleuribacter pedis TaxID=442870 RepID=A0A8J7QR22_9BACT|nr:23S rRNA (adenine(2503)-C(2))-methyltransferase RlmN [Acanthopleuribacter pedis]MBO1322630.1 23S rRNA (adenine(2503)-C(2))-methyltransferase RlmN [Acanthopleuribacter pedis]